MVDSRNVPLMNPHKCVAVGPRVVAAAAVIVVVLVVFIVVVVDLIIMVLIVYASAEHFAWKADQFLNALHN